MGVVIHTLNPVTQRLGQGDGQPDLHSEFKDIEGNTDSVSKNKNKQGPAGIRCERSNLTPF